MAGCRGKHTEVAPQWGRVGFTGWLDGLFMLRREWCLVAGLRRPLGSSKRDSVKLDRVVVELLECGRVVARSLSKIGVFAVVFLIDFGIAHIVKNDLITFDVPPTIAIQPRVVPHRDRAQLVWLGSNVNIVTDSGGVCAFHEPTKLASVGERRLHATRTTAADNTIKRATI
jgi:hypothetical protein